MRKNEILSKLENVKTRSVWSKGVKAYAFMILEDIEDDIEITQKVLLNGAKNWKQYSEGGSALIYDFDIANMLCTPSEKKRFFDKYGVWNCKAPNKQENWLDVQARALYQACNLILNL